MSSCWMWWHILLIIVLARWRQESQEFESRLSLATRERVQGQPGYMRHYLNNKKKKERKEKEGKMLE